VVADLSVNGKLQLRCFEMNSLLLYTVIEIFCYDFIEF